MHFVPGGNEKFFAKGLSGDADTLVLDLEDSVPAGSKDHARAAVTEWLDARAETAKELMVRVNAAETPWHRADLDAVVAAAPESLMVPKVDGSADLDAVWRLVTSVDPDSQIGLFSVATETAAGVLSIAAIAGHPRSDGICWGAEDLSAVLGASRSRDDQGDLLPVFRTVQSMCLIGAAAGGVGAVDAVFTDLRDLAGLRREAELSAAMGFVGKITIHPDQIAVVNDAFTPSAAAVLEATEMLEANDEHATRGHGAFDFRGQMVDAAHIARAERLLARARRTENS